jgi:predicted permease
MPIRWNDTIRILLNRCVSSLRKSELDAELDEELRAHIELAIEEHVARGMNRRQARQEALRAFGGLTQARENHRMRRGFPLLDQLVRDLRFGVRQLYRAPGFALTAVFTLALGLGANTAVFSLINALLLRPLPAPHADELAVLQYLRSDSPEPDFSFCEPIVRALEKRHDIFQGLAAFTSNTMQVRSGSGNVKVSGALVTGQFFQALETAPLMGRSLTPEDDRRGGTSTGFAVVISEDFWRSWFNAAPDVVGRTLTIANVPFTVVGVMPGTFIGADPTRRPAFYAPLWAEPVIDAPYNNVEGGYHSWWLRIIARRKAEVSLEQANAALEAASNPILDETAPQDANWIKEARAHHFRIAAVPGSKGYTYLRDRFSKPLIVIFSLCGAMLLLACMNLASLLMARSAARERELATRLAMGATRQRLVQQLLVESLLIALLGTAAGMIAAPLVSHSLAALVLGKLPGATLDTSLDLSVLGFVAGTAFVATMLIGLLPALRATSKSLNEQIKTGSNAVTARERKRMLPRVLMGLEVALALMLVVGAGLLATSLARLYRTGLGFDSKGVVNFGLEMSKQSLDGDPLVRLYQSIGDALAHHPGVKSVSFAAQTPMDGSIWTETYRSAWSSGDREIYMNAVSPDFFTTMRIPMLAGRDFRWNDTHASGKKMILSQSAAKTLFPGRDAIGQQVTEAKLSYEVIAVVGDIRYATLRKEAPAEAYVPVTQIDQKKPSYTAVVRVDSSNGSVAPLADAARTLVARMAPELPAPFMTTMSAQLDDSISSERMMAMLSVFFAGCALLVTAIGLYGTLAYATARRTSEIGVRMALGAQRGQVVAMVFRENAWVALSGCSAGLAAALLASRTLQSFLYGTSVRDPWVMIASVAALGLVASAASLLPALRAATIEPMVALRTE